MLARFQNEIGNIDGRFAAGRMAQRRQTSAHRKRGTARHSL
jgi:hypothetical protein